MNNQPIKKQEQKTVQKTQTFSVTKVFITVISVMAASIAVYAVMFGYMNRSTKKVTQVEKVQGISVEEKARFVEPTMPDQTEEPQIVGYIVELKDPSILAKKKLLEDKRKTEAQIDQELTTYKANLDETKSKALADFEKKIGKGKLKDRKEFKNVFNGYTFDIDAKDAKKLKKSDYVKSVTPNYIVQAHLADSVPQINADDIWQLTDDQGQAITGQGITIAILDTGVDYTNPELGACFVPEITDNCFPEEFLESPGQNCADTDGGLNICHHGRAGDSTGINLDSCNNDRVGEVFCDENEQRARTFIDCPLGCSGGVCKTDNDINDGSCTKIIGGHDFVTCEGWIGSDCGLPVEESNDPMDYNGHGTHVAATAAGNGTLKGVAPDANILAYRVLNQSGRGKLDWIISGIERAVDPNQDGDFSDQADVINMSLGGTVTWPGVDLLAQVVNTAVDNGAVTVVSAGNDYDYKRIGTPGVAQKVITVGATDNEDNIAEFSSRGPVDVLGFYLKPDVVAPGSSICAAQLGDAWYENQCLDDKHTAISGTSMAAPHVAGAVALLKQAYPDYTPLQIKSILVTSGAPTNINRYVGHSEWESHYNNTVTTNEICTKLTLGIDVNDPYAHFVWPHGEAEGVDLEAIENAILRTDDNNYPGGVLQQVSWSHSGTYYEGDLDTFRAQLSYVSQGTYWLCMNASQEITIGTRIFEEVAPDMIYDQSTGFFQTPDESINMQLYLKYPVQSSAFDEGGGRIDVLRAYNTPITVSETSLSYGIITEATNVDKTLTITNITGSQLSSVTVSATPARRAVDVNKNVLEDVAAEQYNYLQADLAEMAFDPGSIDVPVTLYVPSNAPAGYYSGKINITIDDEIFDNETFSIPYGFVVLKYTKYQAPRSIVIPTIDGVIEEAEWQYAKHYENRGTDGAYDLYLKNGEVGGEPTLFMGIKVSKLQGVGDNYVGRVYIHFEEGDDGDYGSGSLDRRLVFFQEDAKLFQKFQDPYYQQSYPPFDGCYTIDIGFGGWNYYNMNYPPHTVDFEGADHFAGTTYQAELAIPFVGTQGVSADSSDIVVTYGDILGFGIHFPYTVEAHHDHHKSLPDNIDLNDAFTYHQLEFSNSLSCTDGTFYDACSVVRPMYCENGQLIPDCQQCGCPTQQGVCQSDGTCKKGKPSQPMELP